MKKTIINLTIRTVSFLACAVVLFSCISSVLERKTNIGAWNYMAKLNEFYNIEENTMDYIGIGSSHMYCSLNPLEVWNQSGIAGFVLATQQQPLMASYHYIKEAFKTQSPKFVVVEGLMMYWGTEFDSAVLYDAIDPLKFSLNKIQMINNLVEYDQRPEYYFNILKYHTRWREISLSEINNAFSNPEDTYKGFVALDGKYQGVNSIPDYESMADKELSEYNLDVLNKIHELISENGAQMVLMLAPYDTKKPKIYEAMKAGIKWAEQNDVPVLDYALMLDEIGIDPLNDYYDAGHLDVSGAAKLSAHFASFLQKQGLSKSTDIDQKKWQTDYDIYVEKYQADLNNQ